MTSGIRCFDITDSEGLEMTPAFVKVEEVKGLYDAMVVRRCEDVPLTEDTKRCSNLNKKDPDCSYSFYVRSELKRVCLCHLALVEDTK